MDKWFEDLVEEIIWKALRDSYQWLAGTVESKIEDKLNELTVGEEMGSSPKVTVIEVTSTTVTFLVRGRMNMFKKALSPFMRIEAVVSKDVDLTSGGTPIEIADWHTVIGDIDIKTENVFSASLAFGYDKGSWLGQGAFKVLPGGFGLDVTLGGLNDRGLMIGLDLDLPTSIPLGSTGLGLIGMGGDFAYNFTPRLEKLGVAIPDPTAADYITWARNTEVDRWISAPIEETAVGIGVRTDLATIFDNGWSLKLEPIGLAVLTPGPVFVLGGVGKLLKTDSARIEGYVAVDIPSGSLALGLGVHLKIPDKGPGKLVDGKGILDALFSFRDPSIWYVNFGTQTKPITAKVLNNLWNAELFLMLDNTRVFFGAGLSLGGSWSWWKITLTARVGARVGLLVGWNPQELGGYFEIWGELGLKVWKFSFKITGAARVIGHTPNPTQLDFEFKYKLDLPWPIPDIKGKATFSYTDEDPIGPPLASPLLAGSSSIGGVTSAGDLKIGGLHEITGRQWDLDANKVWPDTTIVVPFAARTTDGTNLVIGPDVGKYVQGGYEVNHTLNKLELHDLVNNTLVSGVGAVWAAGPGGDTARLHVLGSDPFSWLTPHTDTIHSSSETPGSFKLQRFGFGPPEEFSGERSFGELRVEPADSAKLVTDLAPALPTRVMECGSFELRWERSTGQAIGVDPIVIYLVGLDPDQTDLPEVGPMLDVQTSEGPSSVYLVTTLYGALGLYAAIINPAGPISTLTVHTSSEMPLLVYGVAALEDRKVTEGAVSKTVLKPGRYRLDIEGESTASHPAGDPDLPDSAPVSWEDSQEFEVDYPASLRSYIAESTIGDERLFGVASEWNPTMHGVGFPHYRGYWPVVRFVVPYMTGIFSTIKLSVLYDDGASVSDTIVPSTNPDGTTSLPDKAQNWVTVAGGTVHADEEVVFDKSLSKSGPASIRLGFDHPTTGDTKLDEWSAHVSAFPDFRSHLAWSEKCIKVLYDNTGPQKVDCCPPIPEEIPPPKGRGCAVALFDGIVKAGRTVIGNVVPSARKKAEVAVGVTPVIPVEPYPDELTSVPLTWRLGPDLKALLKSLHAGSGIDYARFAHEAKARFNSGSGDRLEGLGAGVEDTTIESIVDGIGRPLALWIRTPEPVDWRRVTASLRIKHVTPSTGCPSAYAKRHPLNLAVTILPSPDASSAFLVGGLGGVHTRLPRGEFELTVTFDPIKSGIPSLRPSPTVTTSTETVKHTFIQASGQDWPLPKTTLPMPAGVLEYLLAKTSIDPDDIPELSEHLRPWDPDPAFGDIPDVVIGTTDPVIPDPTLPSEGEGLR